jgi:hypothetical protein
MSKERKEERKECIGTREGQATDRDNVKERWRESEGEYNIQCSTAHHTTQHTYVPLDSSLHAYERVDLSVVCLAVLARYKAHQAPYRERHSA